MTTITTHEAVERIRLQMFSAQPVGKRREAARHEFERMLRDGEVRLWAGSGVVTRVVRWGRNREQRTLIDEIIRPEELFASHVLVCRLSRKATSWSRGALATTLIDTRETISWPYHWRAPTDPTTGKALVQVKLCGLHVEREALEDALGGDAPAWEPRDVQFRPGDMLPASLLDVERGALEHSPVIARDELQAELERLEARERLGNRGPVYEAEAASWVGEVNARRAKRQASPVGARTAEKIIRERAEYEGRRIGFSSLRAVAHEIAASAPGYAQDGTKKLNNINEL